MLILSGCPASLRPSLTAPWHSEAEVRDRARELFSAYDGHDEARLAPLLAPGFVHVDRARVFDRDFTLEQLKARRARQAVPRTRACREETVHRSAGAAVYVAECTVTAPGEPGKPPGERVGLDSVVWAADAPGRAVLWSSQLAGVEGERELWNDVYRQGVGFTQAPNRLLVQTVSTLPPGRALDLMMGQGRNALFLASRGWKVTGVDLSDEGVRLARELAARQGLALEAVVADVDRFDLGVEQWDLVTMIYAGADRAHLERAKASLRPGGVFLLEYFAAGTATGANLGGVASGELARLFSGWKVLRDEEVEDVADWGTDRTRLARFVARKP